MALKKDWITGAGLGASSASRTKFRDDVERKAEEERRKKSARDAPVILAGAIENPYCEMAVVASFDDPPAPPPPPPPPPLSRPVRGIALGMLALAATHPSLYEDPRLPRRR